MRVMTTIYIDEAGRGPLAWPVSVGVIMQLDENVPSDFFLSFDDSKKLTEKKREELYDVILDDSRFAYAWAYSSAKQIDKHGIIKAQQKAIIKAIHRMLSQHLWVSIAMSLTATKQLLQQAGISLISIDGNHTFGIDKKLEVTVETTIKGDSLIPQISMASILAKVTRDRYMKKQAKKYPCYGFEQHKGYGTKKHREAIVANGPCPLHRMTFIYNILHPWN